ncbi:cullin-1-like isoform X2 [Punica granatum]|uniref:Cullin-1-like isoform X2 n=1 Tax=Punica granatum TaxID=22663 RepID=A0A6P8CY88_PUNGR|nr:cullin-1-like isoform X2 [Punica granatum]
MPEGIMDWLRKYRRLETRCKVGPLPGMDTIDRAISTILPDNRGVPSRPTSTDTNDASLVAEAQGIVLDMCTKQPPSHYSKHPLCQVLPSLRVKSALLLLQGLIQRWLDHDAIVGRLLYLFQPLKQHYISREKLPSVMQAALRMFLLVVFDQLHDKLRILVLSMVCIWTTSSSLVHTLPLHFNKSLSDIY